MKSLSQWTIRATLAALALCATAPAIGIVMYHGLTEIERSSRDIEGQAMGLAQTLAAQQTMLAENTRLLLMLIAGMPEVKAMDAARSEAVFAKLLKDNPVYSVFALLSPDGKLAATTTPHRGAVDFSDRDYYREVLRTRAFSVGAYALGRISDEERIHFAMPVLSDSGELVGVLMTAFPLPHYNGLFSRIPVPPGMRCALVDPMGERLYRYPGDPAFPLGASIPRPISERIAASQGDSGVFAETSSDAVQLYNAFVKLRLGPGSPHYMTVLAGAPLPGAKAVLTGGFGRSMALMLAALILSLIVARILGEMTIGAGVDALIRATRRLSGGDLTARAGELSACLEIVALGAAFDKMTGELADREAKRLEAETALRASEFRFRQVFERSPAGILLFDGKGVVTACNSRLAEMMGAQAPQDIVGIDMPARIQDGPIRDSVLRTIETGEAQYEGPYVSLSSGKHLVIQVQTREISSGVYMAVIEDLTGRVRAEETLRLSLAEKTTLLREVHHRVKNNLQIITSLINLQTAKTADPATREAFSLMQSRVRSMAMIHDRLYRSESFSAVDMGDHIRELVARISGSYKDVSRNVRLTVDAEPLLMGIDAAIPCGLLVNELTTNAFKHAFAANVPGELRVSFRRENGKAVLEIADDGPGLPEGFRLEAAESLGMQLIAALTDQLGGAISVQTGPGTRFRVEFPV
ncbi:MAG: PAS domain S-box protein [Desulfovibrionaceae bacterium]|nr:PAS domain S-box protein [Desulfovibrionaceae bacterium]MBF0513595.1 PAS domain S-box protein [Desulfovibrionaceae bacterium]